ncbi:MAG: ImmA/IrrE family metallo-endopeptidase [Bacteroidaceae bacterium]|nr:ImmA/IrrE family metallo-endopeptidase [Bacteroidaceae bacterium]
MNTTRIGTDYENRVYQLFSSLLKESELSYANSKYSQIYQHKKYSCIGLNRTIDFDITIETYNPNTNQEEWSSLVVIECKCLTKVLDISDIDEFETKLKKVSDSGIKGIIVTTKGFSANGIEQARRAHIALMKLSDEQYEWVVSRNINKSEDTMQMFLGTYQSGLTPIVYAENSFQSLYDYLNQAGVNTTEKNVIDIPWLEKEDIRKRANELYLKLTIPTNDIAGTILAQEYPDYRISFEDLPQGILGTLSFSKKIITLSNEIISDIHRRNFTLAHELGHIHLHEQYLRNYKSDYPDYVDGGITRFPDKLIKSMEFQANSFASYLLMPHAEFIYEVNRLFEEYFIRKGYLYLDSQSCNKQNVLTILGVLSTKFNVSKEAVKNRLLNEKLLVIEDGNPQRLNDVLRKY